MKLQSATINLICAQVSDNQEQVNVSNRSISSGQVGTGNLNIESLQDTDQYKKYAIV